MKKCKYLKEKYENEGRKKEIKKIKEKMEEKIIKSEGKQKNKEN